MNFNNAGDVVEELFKSLFLRYQIGLETSMRGSDFIFDLVQLLYCKGHKFNFKCGGSYIDSPDRRKKKKVTVNLKNGDDRCFQYAITVALHYWEIKLHPEKVLNIRPFINKYNWGGIKYPSKINDWETCEKNNPTVARNFLYIKEMEICPAYISKINLDCEKANNSLIDIKQRKTLSQGKISIIKRNNIKTPK